MWRESEEYGSWGLALILDAMRRVAVIGELRRWLPLLRGMRRY